MALSLDRKSLLVGSLLLITLLSLLLGYRSYTKSFSPEAVAQYAREGFSVQVQYSQPARRNRLIFGRESDQALVPYGKVWRTGANEATLITFSGNVRLAGLPLRAGTYSLWTIPGPGRWQVIINQETGQWGTQYNDGLDIARREVPIRVRQKAVENFTIYFEDQPRGAALILSWEHTEAVVPITWEEEN